MPVTTKSQLEPIQIELGQRYQHLVACLKDRPLKSPYEGAGGGIWEDSEKMVSTTGTAMDIRLAVQDFSAILKEIARLK
jgi:hypothetical protein